MISKGIKRFLSSYYARHLLKRLGYPEGTKLLIIHADDLGLSFSENAATISAIETGLVNSGSVMVPCPGFNEIVDYAGKNPGVDLGIHLTLTSEWRNYKWKPVLPSDDVKSLVDSNGYFLPRKTELIKSLKIEDARKEFRAQIKKALDSGLDLTHIDSHMFVAFINNEVTGIYSELGNEFNLPVLLKYNKYSFLLNSINDILATGIFIAGISDYERGFADYYRDVIRSMQPGLNIILVHLAFDTPEMQNITEDIVNSGSAWRNAEYNFFVSDECRDLIIDNGIQLITWREIRDRLIR